jgi:serine/threonine protein kinase/WD40 repeat protein
MRQLFDDEETINVPPPTPSVFTSTPGLPELPRFALIDVLGQGGFAVVYRARQLEPVVREVAVKLLKGQMATPDVLARFEVERRTLARMEHPGIARLWDAGLTISGQPFFAMELVRGVPVTRFCDQRNLSLRQRLEMFGEICAAVQHAHEKGVLHRDLKPSNILASDDGTIKVIDFGIAKALEIDPDTTESAPMTGMHQMIGTPGYMSPEQAGMDVRNVDARSDIYALGVILYELITGKTPLAVERVAEDDASRWPVARSVMDPSKVIGSRLISPMEKRDLNAITRRSLETESAQRYPSAAALAADVQRHLGSEPVEAAERSFTYAAAKFARRHTAVFMGSSLALLAIVIGFAVSTVLYLKEQASRAELSLALSKAHFVSAQMFKQDSDYQSAVVSLTSALRQETTFGAAAVDLQMLLTHDISPQPTADPFTLDPQWGPPINGAVSASGRTLLILCAKGSTQRLMLLHHDGARWAERLIEAPALVEHMALAASNDVLAFADRVKTVRLMSITTADTSREWTAPFPVTALSMGVRDGQCAVGCNDGSVWLLSMDDKPAKQVGKVKGFVTRLEFQMPKLFVGSDAGEVWELDIVGTSEGQRLMQMPASITALGTQARPAMVAAGDALGNVSCYAQDTALMIPTTKQHIGPVTAIALTRQGKSLISAGGSGNLQVQWLDIATKLNTKAPLPSAGLVRAILLSRTGDSVFIVQGDASVRWWPEGKAPALTVRKPQQARLLALSSQGRALGVMRESGTSVECCVLAEHSALGRHCHSGHVTNRESINHDCLAFTPDGTSLTMASANGDVSRWDTERIHALGEARWSSRPLSIAHDSNNSLIAAMNDGSLLRAQVDGSAPQTLVPSPPEKSWPYAAVSPDGSAAIWSTTAPDQITPCNLRLWWKDKPALVETITQGRIASVAIHGPGGLIALGLSNGFVRVLQRNSKASSIIPMHQAEVTRLAFSPDGHSLITGAADGTCALWAVPSLSPLTETFRFDAAVHDVIFSGDSRRFAIAAGHFVVAGELAARALIGQMIETPGQSQDLALNHDGTRLAHTSPVSGAMIHDIAPIPSSPVPPWFLTLADTFVSRRMNRLGTIESTEHPGATAIRQLIPTDTSDAEWQSFATWLITHPSRRNLSPWSSLSTEAYIDIVSRRSGPKRQVELRELLPYRSGTDERNDERPSGDVRP